tara:strand:+ start:1860 stop:2567 length:708 start_codon:yes stop_codon:yes gene_type:complete
MRNTLKNNRGRSHAPILSLAVCASGILFTSNAAYAAVINFNVKSGGPTTTNPGYGLWGEGANTWNLSTSTSGTDLVDSGGNPTTVDYTLANWNSANGNGSWGPDDLTNYGRYGANDTPTVHTLTISQLDAGTDYELIFYFADNHPSETIFAQGAGPDTFGESKTTTGSTTYVEGSTGVFSYFNNVTADAGGNVLVQASGSGYETINGFQIRPIPEPTTTALLGLGGLALILRRRK